MNKKCYLTTKNILAFIGFIQSNGWYIFAFIIFLAYIISKLWPRYLKWSNRRAEAAYAAEIKKSKIFKMFGKIYKS